MVSGARPWFNAYIKGTATITQNHNDTINDKINDP